MIRPSLFLLFILSIFLNISEVRAQNLVKDEIAIRSGEQLLTGTLVLPDSAVNVPAVIFIGGIDEYGEYHPNRSSFISENMEAVFPSSGVALLYFNLRGIGGSTGKWQRTSYDEFAADLKSAVDFLKQRREIDSGRIGLIGHGEYAWIAQKVAAEYPSEVSFVASLAAAPYDASRQLINEYHSSYVCEGQDSTGAYDRAVQKAKSHKNWVNIFPWTPKWRHMEMKLDYDPSESIRQLNVPTLFLFAQNDDKVYPSWSVDTLNDMFGTAMPSNFSVQVIPGTDHYFKVAERCAENGEMAVNRSYSFRFREVLKEWVFNNF